MTNNFFEVLKQPDGYPYFEKQIPAVLNLRPNYESVENHQTLHNQVVKACNCQIQRVRTWYEFTESIRDQRPTAITIHYTVINYGYRHVSEFISFIQGLTEYMTKNGAGKLPIPIAIEVDAECPLELIEVSKHTDVLGIVPTADAFGVDRAVEGISQLLKTKSHWPADIINQLHRQPATNKPIHLYFRKNWKMYLTPASRVQMHENIPWDPVYCDSWDKFIVALRDYRPYQIEFHVSLIEESGVAPAEFVSLITNLVTAENRKSTPIAVVIEPDTPLNLVKELKEAGVFGLVPSSTGFGVEATKIAIQALFERTPYWPQHILKRLPNLQKPLHVYIRSDWEEHYTQEFVDEFNKSVPVEARCYTGWDQVPEALRKNPSQIVFHISMLQKPNLSVTDLVTMIQTRMKLEGIDVPIGVDIEPTTPVSIIKELKQAGVFGIVPTANAFGIKESMAAIIALTNRVAHWPKHIINQLPGNKPTPKTSRNGITLTARQQEVMDLVCHRGLSNKQIARALNLSESTVKIHVSAIMKAYGVRNRTQLALSAGAGLKA